MRKFPGSVAELKVISNGGHGLDLLINDGAFEAMNCDFSGFLSPSFGG